MSDIETRKIYEEIAAKLSTETLDSSAIWRG